MTVGKICNVCGAEKRPAQSNQTKTLMDGTVKVYSYIQWRCPKQHARKKKLKNKMLIDNLTAY